MTVEAWTPAATAFIQTLGPFTIPHPYVAGSIRATVVRPDGTRVPLVAGDYTLAPTSSDTAGSLTLTPASFAQHQGAMLEIDRQTDAEQGWQGLLGERERGLERQLDRMVMAQQELRTGLSGALRVRGSIPPLSPVTGAVPMWDGTKFANGPTVAQIANAADLAEQAAAQVAAAQTMLDRLEFLVGTLDGDEVPFEVFATADGQTDFEVPEYPVTVPGRVSVFLNSFALPHGDGWIVPPEDMDGDTTTRIRLTEGVQAGDELIGFVRPFSRTEVSVLPWSNITEKPDLSPVYYPRATDLLIGDPQTEEPHIAETRTILSTLGAARASGQRPFHRVLCAGDIVDHGHEQGRPSYRPNAYTPRLALRDFHDLLGVTRADFLTVLGNHDNEYNANPRGPGALSFRTMISYFGRRSWWVRRGNLVTVGLSPEGRSTAGYYPPDEVTEAKRIFWENRDANRQLMLHHPLNNTFMLANPDSAMNGVVVNSEDFAWLNTPGYECVAVISGHQGNGLLEDDDGEPGGGVEPGTLQPGFVIAPAWNNLRCINVNMPPSRGGVTDRPKSVCYAHFDDGSSTMIVERVNVPAMTLREVYHIPLEFPSRITSAVQVDTRFDHSFLNVSDTKTEKVIVPWPKELVEGVWQPVRGMQWLHQVGAHDAALQNVEAGDGTGYLARVPVFRQASPHNSAPPAPPDQMFSVPGAGWGAERLFNADTDPRSGFALWVRGSDGMVSPLMADEEGLRLRLQTTWITLPPPSLDLGDLANIPPQWGVRQHSGGQLFKIRRRDTPAPRWSAADAVGYLAGHGVTGRALNAGGTLNVPGTDYAVYFRRCDRMILGSIFVTPGQIVGLDATGQITDLWAEAISGFLIKSTSPNLVGNDGWGSAEALGVSGDDEAGLSLAAEGERPEHDRLSMSGMVPTLIAAVSGDVGKWLVPVQDGTGISGALVADNVITMDQYRARLGRVVAIQGGKAVALVGVM